MAHHVKRKIYPPTLVAVFGVTILYIVSLFAVGVRLSAVDSGTVEFSLLGLTVFAGEKAGLSSSASPTAGFVIVAVLFSAVVFIAWLWSGRRRVVRED